MLIVKLLLIVLFLLSCMCVVVSIIVFLVVIVFRLAVAWSLVLLLIRECNMRFIASIELKDGSVITLPLSCREYHAQKLQYVFSRTLDRSVVASCSVLAVESAVNRPIYLPALKMEVLDG